MNITDDASQDTFQRRRSSQRDRSCSHSDDDRGNGLTMNYEDSSNTANDPLSKASGGNFNEKMK